MSSFQRFMDEALDAVRAGAQAPGPMLRDLVELHLGVDPASVPVVRLEVATHQFVNLDVAIEALLAEHGGESWSASGEGTSATTRRSATCLRAAVGGGPRSGRWTGRGWTPARAPHARRSPWGAPVPLRGRTRGRVAAAGQPAAFILTTNRADLLEEALSQRPGGGSTSRSRSRCPTSMRDGRCWACTPATHQSAGPPWTLQPGGVAASRPASSRSSPGKELARRTVLIAAEADDPVDDHVLADTLSEMLSDTEQLSRALLSCAPGDGDSADPVGGQWGMWPEPGLAP